LAAAQVTLKGETDMSLKKQAKEEKAEAWVWERPSRKVLARIEGLYSHYHKLSKKTPFSRLRPSADVRMKRTIEANIPRVF
jgi:hypothetical protein